MIKAVLFDFDGVLTLDETGSQSICNYISESTGIDNNTFKKEYRKYNEDLLIGKIKHEDVWQKICDAIGQQIKIDVLQSSFINTPINMEVLALMQNVKAVNLKVAMVTDNKADRIRNIVTYHRWESLFDCISVSAEVGSGKNQENIFRSTFQILAVKPEECIFIDNNKENLIVPNRLGIHSIFFDHSKNDVVSLKNKLIEVGIAL